MYELTILDTTKDPAWHLKQVERELLSESPNLRKAMRSLNFAVTKLMEKPRKRSAKTQQQLHKLEGDIRNDLHSVLVNQNNIVGLSNPIDLDDTLDYIRNAIGTLLLMVKILVEERNS